MPNIISFTFDLGAMTPAQASTLVANYCSYSATLPDGSANPETQTVFVKRQVALALRNLLSAAQSDAVQKANPPIIIT